MRPLERLQAQTGYKYKLDACKPIIALVARLINKERTKMARSQETIRLEQQERARIMRAARKLMTIIDNPVLMIFKDSRGRLTLWENPQPFNDVMDFEYSD